jgi:hypothetical protein
MILGRPVRPFAFGLSIIAALIAALILTEESVWGRLDVYSATVAALAIGSTTCLWVGWWAHSTRGLRWGLLAAANVFAARGIYIGVTSGNWLTAGISLALALMAGGGYLLEAPHPWRRHVRRIAGDE